MNNLVSKLPLPARVRDMDRQQFETLFTSGAFVITTGFMFLNSIMLARALGDGGRGEVAAVFGNTVVLGWAFQIGVPNAVAYFAKDADNRRLIMSSWAMTLFVTLPMALALTPFFLWQMTGDAFNGPDGTQLRVFYVMFIILQMLNGPFTSAIFYLRGIGNTFRFNVLLALPQFLITFGYFCLFITGTMTVTRALTSTFLMMCLGWGYALWSTGSLPGRGFDRGRVGRRRIGRHPHRHRRLRPAARAARVRLGIRRFRAAPSSASAGRLRCRCDAGVQRRPPVVQQARRLLQGPDRGRARDRRRPHRPPAALRHRRGCDHHHRRLLGRPARVRLLLERAPGEGQARRSNRPHRTDRTARMTPATFRLLARPAWLAIIFISVLAAALVALYMGLQQDTKQTATTFVFGQRVGYIDRPNPVLDEHLNGIVNAVEFPDVFFAIEDRTRLKADTDYSFTIERLDDTQSVIQIDVRADRAGDAERIARILAEEVVNFVLREQEETLTTQIIELDQSIGEILDDQTRVRRETLGVNPVVARNRIEGQLIGLADDDTVVGTLEGELLSQLAVIQPLAEQFNRNLIELNALYADRARTVTERSDGERNDPARPPVPTILANHAPEPPPPPRCARSHPSARHCVHDRGRWPRRRGPSRNLRRHDRRSRR